MVLKRVIPILQLDDGYLVKTTKFKKPDYIGDPINTLRIFNELEVDEIAIIDIRATLENREPEYEILANMCDECFMPLAYGGGINKIAQASKILSMGFEKIIINTAAFTNPSFITEMANEFGSQAVVVSVDVSSNFFGKKKLVSRSAKSTVSGSILENVKKLEALGAGELIITSVDNEGTWKGYDMDIINTISRAVNIPVIVNGGAGSVEDLNMVLSNSNINAAGVGNMVVYQGKDLGVLINFPDRSKFKGWK